MSGAWFWLVEMSWNKYDKILIQISEKIIKQIQIKNGKCTSRACSRPIEIEHYYQVWRHHPFEPIRSERHTFFLLSMYILLMWMYIAHCAVQCNTVRDSANDASPSNGRRRVSISHRIIPQENTSHCQPSIFIKS